MDEVDFTILAATSVLGDLVDKCPPAEACRDAFERMSRATVQMCLAGGRGPMSKIAPSGTFAQSSGVAGATGMSRGGMAQATRHPATVKEEDDEDDDDDDEEGGIEEVAPGFTKDFESMTRTFAGSRQNDDYEPMSATTPPLTTQEQQEEDQLVRELKQQEQHQQEQRQQQRQQQQQQQAEQRKRQPHFDEDFRELFTPAAGGGSNTVPSLRFNQQQLHPSNPHHPHPVSTPSPQYALSPSHNFAPHHPLTFSSPTHTHNQLPLSLQHHFQSPSMDQDGMSIDPQLAQPVDWGNLDMSAFGLGSLDWEGDAWSDSGSTGGVAGSGNAAGQGMDLFDGFFFGPGGA